MAMLEMTFSKDETIFEQGVTRTKGRRAGGEAAFPGTTERATDMRRKRFTKRQFQKFPRSRVKEGLYSD